MKNIQWNDGMKNRSRTPRLWVSSGPTAEWVQFVGKTLPGVAVAGRKYQKNGKWSNTTFDLIVADAATVVEVCEPFNYWGLTWADLAQGVVVLAGPEMTPRDVMAIMRAGAARGVYAKLVARADEAQAALDAIVAAEPAAVEYVIVARHAATIEWLRRQGIVGAVVESPRAADVRGKRVIGALPMHLAALAEKVGVVTVAGSLPATADADQMAAAGATLRWYRTEVTE